MGDKTDTKDINNTNDIQAPAEIMATPDITPVSIEKAETEPAAPLSPDEQMIQDGFNELLTDYLNSNHRRKVERITKAFNFANQAHAGVKRRSGEPYIMHPIAVAKIVCKEMGLGSTSICSALLHDVGKPYCRNIKENSDKVVFYDHDNYSTYLAIDVIKKYYEGKIQSK